jgi:GNAT superfamily N-acetyltransferase
MPDLHEAQTDDEIEACYPVMAQLRPHVPAEGFVDLVRRLQAGGYRLAYVKDEGEVRGVAGFRYLEQLYNGKVIYVDDLVTDQEMRSHGYGEALLDWLFELAKRPAARPWSSTRASTARRRTGSISASA